MAKDSRFPRTFWDDPMCQQLQRLGSEHLWVYLHLVHGPSGHVSGLLRVSPAHIGEDTGIDADRVRAVIDELADIGWCEYDAPYLWIRGIGEINTQLGTADFRRNAKWLSATKAHLDSLPQLPIVERYRRYHGIPSDIEAYPIDRVCIGYRYPSASASASASAQDGNNHTGRSGL